MTEQLDSGERDALRQIALEDANPGEGTIHQGFSDMLVQKGLARGNFKAGYSLTSRGQEVLAEIGGL